MSKRTREPSTNDSANPLAKLQKISDDHLRGDDSKRQRKPEPEKEKYATAMEYIEQVKQQFNDRPEVYQEFLKLMRNFKHNKIETAGVIDKIKILFHGRDKLLRDFDNFLPKEFRVYTNENTNSPQLSSPNSLSSAVIKLEPSYEPQPSEKELNQVKEEEKPVETESKIKIVNDESPTSVPITSSEPDSAKKSPIRNSDISTTLLTLENAPIIPDNVNTAPIEKPEIEENKQTAVAPLPQPETPKLQPETAEPMQTDSPKPTKDDSAATPVPLVQALPLQVQSVTPSKPTSIEPETKKPESPSTDSPLGSSKNSLSSLVNSPLATAMEVDNVTTTPTSQPKTISNPLKTSSNSILTPNLIPLRTSNSNLLNLTPVIGVSSPLRTSLNPLQPTKSSSLTSLPSQTPSPLKTSTNSIPAPPAATAASKDPVNTNKQLQEPEKSTKEQKDSEKEKENKEPIKKPEKSGSKIPTIELVDASKNNEEMAILKCRSFIHKVKSRFELQPNQYKQFIRTIYLFTVNQISSSDLFCKITNLLKDQVDLLFEFPKYLPDPASTRLKTYNKNVANVKDYNFFESIKQQLRNESHLYNEFLKCLGLFNNGIITELSELLVLVEDLFSEYPEIYNQFKSLCFDKEQSLQVSKLIRFRENDKESAHSIHSKEEIDYSTCKRYGPSYRLLPKEFIHPPSSGRTLLCDQVLNDEWVSLPTGSEEGANFKSSRKNQYEEILFKCEDDRYELDMVIELNYSTLLSLKAIYKKITDKTPNLENQQLTTNGGANGSHSVQPDHAMNDHQNGSGGIGAGIEVKLEDIDVDILHIRSIERIYGDKAQDAISGLFQNPIVAIPLIIRRLEQKDYEWRQARLDWNKQWRVINEKNYHKSLDHQSSNFKLKDVKRLNDREFFYEINKQKYEKKLNNLHDDHLSFNFDHFNLIFPDIIKLVHNQAIKTFTSSPSAIEEFKLFLDEFLFDFFNYTNPILTQSHSNINNTASTQQPSQPVNGNNQPSSNLTAKKKTLYGTDEFYIFFRFFQVFYSRVSKIMKMATTTIHERIPSNVRKLITVDPIEPPGAKFDSMFDIYRNYIDNLLSPLLLGELEQSKYEEECKSLFGISSYTLFTIDKIIKTIVAQIQVLFSDDLPSRLLALYSFETNRSIQTSENLAYKTNALQMVDDGRPYRFTFFMENEDRGKLSINLLDNIRTPSKSSLANAKKNYTKYIDTYLHSSSSKLSITNSKLFLIRNTKKVIRSPGWSKNLIVENSLEGKICMTTYRMFYVRNTEDFFYRKRSSKSHPKHK